MNLRKFASKMVTGVAVAGMTVSAFAPALATDQVYEQIPEKGVRFALIDAGQTQNGGTVDFTPDYSEDLYKDLAPINSSDAVDKGVFWLYGNGKNDDNGKYSYENIEVILGSDHYNGSRDPLFKKLGVVFADMSNANTPLYSTYVYDVSSDEYYVYTQTDNVPETNVSKLEDLVVDAMDSTKGEIATGLLYSKPASGDPPRLLFDDLLAKVRSTSGDQTKGDPDIMADYYDEAWVYLEDENGDQKAWHIDLELSSVDQGVETDDVSNLKVQARGPVTRVNFDPLLDDESGVIGYEVQVTGEHDTNNDGAMTVADTEPYKWFTKHPVMFFDNNIDEKMKVTVSSINAKGQTSEGIDTDADGDDNWKAELIEIEDELSDLDREDAEQKFYDYIQYLYKLAIIDGYSDGTYKEDEYVTRGALSKFIVNAFRVPIDLSGEKFPDVDVDNTFFTYIQSLKNADVVGGYRDGSFGPDDLVNRGQLTKFIFNAATHYDEDAISTGVKSCFPDTDSHTFEEYICALSDYNDDSIMAIIGGYSNGNYGPDDNLTRGQMAKVILNSAGIIDRDHDTADTSFIAHNYWLTDYTRPFVPPVMVEDFESPDITTGSVTLEWEDLYQDDPSVDAYMLEVRKADSSSDWDPVKVTTDDTGATVTLNVQQSPSVNVGFQIGTCAVTLDVSQDDTGDDSDCAGDQTATLGIKETASAEVKDANGVATVIDDLTNIQDSNGNDILVGNAGTSTSVTFTQVDNVVDTEGSLSAQGEFDATGLNDGSWSFTHTAATISNNDGILLAPQSRYVDNDVKDDTKYEYRLSALKFVPYKYSENTYADQDALEDSAQYSKTENMIFGATSEVTATTEENP